ncbi:NADH-quinone oxidoreductase subunit N [Corynebacterium uterequi]|uniref:NADH-quinone oxidoreductase subunit N n=1 Tax=Corynebacterium uterequi TaxID=1072256 RepID=A0A0G3HFE3_9CORY|nr:NADH-quinone oxidoreductase subunit N [Corynebacterium uterequi]AKK10633.1 NADH:ubiquinone oxidoreductase subunit 2 (chain N) [Corynebacterium uterequi]
MLSSPAIDYLALAPILILAAGACIGVLAAAFKLPRGGHVALAVVSIVAALAAIIHNAGSGLEAAQGLLTLDDAGYVMSATLLLFGLLAVILYRPREPEVYPLTVFSLLGMMIFIHSSNLLMLFVALEVFSLPLYIMCCLDRYRLKISQEAALKYFFLGCFAAAFMLYSIVLIYAETGTLDYTSASGIGAIFVLVGLVFKMGVVPFHVWVPDVYQGAPTPVTAFMAIATKLAAVAATARFLTLVDAKFILPILLALAMLSMFYGGIVAIAQNDVKRLIAYSSIGHAGFILTALIGAGAGQFTIGGFTFSAATAAWVYLLAYGFATIGAFALVTSVRAPHGAENDGAEANSFAAWSGLGRTNPWLAAAMTVFFLSFAGIPATAGFVGKLVAFSVPWLVGFPWLVVVALVASAVAAFAYFRFIALLYFGTPGARSVAVPAPAGLLIAVCVLATVGLGLFPGSLASLMAATGL